MDLDDEFFLTRLRDSLRLLIGKREPAYPNEAAIRFVEFAVWAQFPDDLDLVQAAGAQAATIFLRAISSKFATAESPRASAATLARLLSNVEYGRLYDDAIAPTGGWFDLGHILHLKGFSDAFDKRSEENEIVSDLVEFQMRYLRHFPEAKVNITRAYAFCFGDPARISFQWKTNKKVYKQVAPTVMDLQSRHERMSGKTMRTRWGKSKQNAAFIFVIQNSNIAFAPSISSFFQEKTLRHQLPTPAKMVHFLGMCAYVNEQLSQIGNAGIDQEYFPAVNELPRIRPRFNAVSRPFSDEERQRLTDHDKLYLKFQES